MLPIQVITLLQAIWAASAFPSIETGSIIGRYSSDPLRIKSATFRSSGFLDLRGGSSVQVDEEDEDEEESEEGEGPLEEAPVPISGKPITVLVQTNLGNSVLDHVVEILSSRTKNIATLKKSVSRQLPGKPPVIGMDLIYEGKSLDDEMLIQELFDGEEEGDDDDYDEDQKVMKLVLNMVPPVSPKFAIELQAKLVAEKHTNVEPLPTADLIEAYYLNQAAMQRNARLLANPTEQLSPMMRLEMQQEAEEMKKSLQEQVPESVWEEIMKPVVDDTNIEERRGQRYRSGAGGAKNSLKKSLQHNLNINWPETIQHTLLFLFFGYFGGRNTFARSAMLWGAPMCFIIQLRPVKVFIKQMFYLMHHPPGVILSLLPAPQQAILGFDMKKSYAALYDPEGKSSTSETELDQDEGTEESEGGDAENDEYDSDGGYDDEDDE